MREIEIFAGIEPIGGLTAVSEPLKDLPGPIARATPEEAQAHFDRIRRAMGG